VTAKVSVMVVEPRTLHERHLRLLRWTHGRYHRIFTHDPKLLRSAPNARFLTAARTWVPEWDTLDLSKTDNVSLIASNRRDLEGHKLRHAVAEAATGVALMGRGYAPFEHKHEGLAPFRFSVVIENVRAGGYFSEKLVDALFCHDGIDLLGGRRAHGNGRGCFSSSCGHTLYIALERVFRKVALTKALLKALAKGRL
jgi:hypothetical protein